MLQECVGASQVNKMPMYLLRQPERLESLALAKLGRWIAVQAEIIIPTLQELRERDDILAEALLSRLIETIRSRLACNVPRMLFNALSDTTTRALSMLCPKVCPKYRKHVFGRMIETLFTKHLTYLELNENWFLASIYLKSYLIPGLTHLILTSDSEPEIIMFLRELQSLKYLAFNSFSLPIGELNNIVRCIAQNCISIEELDFSNTDLDLNDDTMDLLSGLRSLRGVHLSYHASVSLTGIETLLSSCSRIENINHVGNQNVIAEVLELLASNKKYYGEVLRLKTCNIVSMRQLELVIRMCPLVENVSVDRYSGHNDLILLTGLPNLRELKLIEHNFYDDRVKDLLTLIGCNLVHLELSQVEQIDLKALRHISQVCPNLKSLTLYRCTFERNTPCASCVYSGRMAWNSTGGSCATCCGTKLEVLPFRNINSLVIWERARSESLSIRLQMLLFVFSNCLNVEFITFSSNFPTPADFMVQVLNKNPLTFLKQLEIGRGVEITASIIDRLINNCIHLPEVKMLVY